MLKGGLVSITFRHLSPQAIIDLVKKTGLIGIEWGGDIHVPHGDINQARRVAEATVSAGLTVAAYGSYFQPGKPDCPEFSTVLNTALALGAPDIRVWAGCKASAEYSTKERQALIDTLRHISRQAAEKGCRVCCEYHKGTLTDTRESVRQMLDELAEEPIGFYWQPAGGHTHKARYAGLKELGHRLAHLHVFHWTDAGRHPLADGSKHWHDYLRCENVQNETRYALIEFVQNNDPEQFLNDATTLCHWLKHWMQK